jgi:hypothetical protein
MKQKILEALKAKFPGVNANVLNRIADKLAKTVTTDEQITTAIAGVTKEFIEIIESYGDSVRQKPNRQPYKPMKPNTV